jgi:SAM-dependent methyltransferase
MEHAVTYTDSLGPHARALRDYFDGETDATIVLHSSLGETDEIPVSVFFRGPDDFFSFDRAALQRCRGRILDLGAGTGVHSLYLQDHGFEVCAVDVLADAVEIMRRRGVRDARLGDVTELDLGRFDTILMMMNGTGILGTLKGLDRFLCDVPRLMAEGGQILVDSGPARVVGGLEEPAVEVTLDEDAYPGEAWITLAYKGKEGRPFRELYVDAETLAEHAEANGFECEIVFWDEMGGYVARLTRE